MAENSDGRLTTGWKIAIVVALLGALTGGGKAERDARDARNRANQLQSKVRQLDSRLDKLEALLRKDAASVTPAERTEPPERAEPQQPK